MDEIEEQLALILVSLSVIDEELTSLGASSEVLQAAGNIRRQVAEIVNLMGDGVVVDAG